MKLYAKWSETKYQPQNKEQLKDFLFTQNIEPKLIDVSQIDDMKELFKGKADFNKEIGGWDTSKVTTMEGMFEGASSFNQEIAGWNVVLVWDMRRILKGASAFTGDLNPWRHACRVETEGMFEGSGVEDPPSFNLFHLGSRGGLDIIFEILKNCGLAKRPPKFTVEFYDKKDGEKVYSLLPIKIGNTIINSNPDIQSKALSKLGDRTNKQVGLAVPGEPNESENAVFVEWRNDSNDIAWDFANNPLKKNLKLYAHWDPTYEVNFQQSENGAVLLPSRKKIIRKGFPIENSNLIPPPNPPTNPNFRITTLAAWYYKDKNDQPQIYKKGDPVEANMILYPEWEKKVDVTFYLYKNKSNQLQNEITVYKKMKMLGVSIDPPGPPPGSPTNLSVELVDFTALNSSNSAKFIEWRNEANDVAWNFEDSVNQHLKLYAFWEETYQVKIFKSKKSYNDSPSSPWKTFLYSKGDKVHVPSLPEAPTHAEAGLSSPNINPSYKARFSGKWLANGSPWDFQNDRIGTAGFTLYPKWEIAGIKVTFKNRETDLTGEDKYFSSDSGENLLQPTNPTPPKNSDLSFFTSANSGNANYKAYFEGWHYEDAIAGPKKWDFDGTVFPRLYDGLVLYGQWSVTNHQPTNQNELRTLLFSQGVQPKLIDISEITDISDFFKDTIFNEPIDGWDTSNVKNMGNLFLRNASFNQSIGGWNTSKVINMQGVFAEATNFNKNLYAWDTRKVIKMNSMFEGAQSFDKPIKNWNLSSAGYLQDMFKNARNFKQDMSQYTWKPKCTINYILSMFEGSGIENHSSKHPPFYKEYKNSSTSSTNYLSLRRGNCIPSIVTFYRTQEEAESGTGKLSTFHQDLEITRRWEKIPYQTNPLPPTNREAGFTNAQFPDYRSNFEGWHYTDKDRQTKKWIFGNTFADNGAREDIKLFARWHSTTNRPLDKAQLEYIIFNQKVELHRIDTSLIRKMDNLFHRGSTWEKFNFFKKNPGYEFSISGWNVSNVEDMKAIFYASPLNPFLGGWNVSSLKDVSAMFLGEKGNHKLNAFI